MTITDKVSRRYVPAGRANVPAAELERNDARAVLEALIRNLIDELDRSGLVTDMVRAAEAVLAVRP